MDQLTIQQLKKIYSDGKLALDNFCWELEQGIYGLLGPNGAGKSTLLEILSLNLMPTSGKVLWNGKDIQKQPVHFRRALGYLPQTYGFYPELKGRQVMNYMGRLHGIYGKRLRRRVDEVLELVNLKDVQRRKVKGYSGGMKQRLAIGQALIHQPKVLVIDEPTTGLDPEERVAFRNMLYDLGQVCIVLLSTHIVKDVEFSCKEMTMLFGGEQRFTGRPSDFVRQTEGRVMIAEIPFDHFDDFTKSHHVVAIQERELGIEVRFIASPTATHAPGQEGEESSADQYLPITSLASGSKNGFTSASANLEDAYVDFIRRQAQEVELDESA